MKQRAKKSPTKYLKWLLVILVVVIIAVLLIGLSWATFTRPPLPEAMQALESDDLVSIAREPWLTFSPTQTDPTTGFIFYPGGRIDPRGYARLMREIASEGYLVVVPEMPFNIAAFQPNAADEIIAYYPDIDRWVIGGHSVGGTMAAQYTDKHGEAIDGLAIWASFPADNADLSDLRIPIISIYGSRELRVNDNSIAECQHLLPEDTLYIRIEGGDHHQFGSYEINPKDHLATTSRTTQQQQIIRATLDLLETVSNTK
jgi:dienelactone hydrolase